MYIIRFHIKGSCVQIRRNKEKHYVKVYSVILIQIEKKRSDNH